MNLAVNNEDESLEDPVEANTNSEPKKKKIPPIFLQLPLNYNEVLNDIKKTAKNEFTTLNTSKSLKINLTTEDDYRALTKLYNE